MARNRLAEDFKETEMPHWEYRKIDLGGAPVKNCDIDLLDDAGRDGWELVGITINGMAFLKRLLPDAAPAATAAKSRAKRPAATSPTASE